MVGLIKDIVDEKSLAAWLEALPFDGAKPTDCRRPWRPRRIAAVDPCVGTWRLTPACTKISTA
jgi:hypothetical protein